MSSRPEAFQEYGPARAVAKDRQARLYTNMIPRKSVIYPK